MDLLGQWSGSLSNISRKQVDKSVSTADFGDLIEFVHLWSGLSLWGVYVGNGHVLHFGVGDTNMMEKMTCSLLQQLTRKSASCRVLKTRICIEPITGLRLLPGTRVRVNNKRHNLVPTTAAEMSYRCHTFVHQEFQYDVLNFNSEHFATFIRYGRAVCNQNPFKKNDETHADTTQTLEMIVRQRAETET